MLSLVDCSNDLVTPLVASLVLFATTACESTTPWFNITHQEKEHALALDLTVIAQCITLRERG